MIKLALLPLIFFSILSCKEIKSTHKESTPKSVLVIQLNKKVSNRRLDSALAYLQINFADLEIKMGDLKKMPDYCKPKKYYRSDSILRFLNTIKPDGVDYLMALTNEHICVDRVLDGQVNPDYRILGYGEVGGDVCVVSPQRTKGTEVFKKTVTHEFMHNLGVRHCTHKTCIMQDGNGSAENIRKADQIHNDCYHRALRAFRN
jgi:predicted Zn-dependent protease